MGSTPEAARRQPADGGASSLQCTGGVNNYICGSTCPGKGRSRCDVQEYMERFTSAGYVGLWCVLECQGSEPECADALFCAWLSLTRPNERGTIQHPAPLVLSDMEYWEAHGWRMKEGGTKTFPRGSITTQAHPGNSRCRRGSRTGNRAKVFDRRLVMPACHVAATSLQSGAYSQGLQPHATCGMLGQCSCLIWREILMHSCFRSLLVCKFCRN